MHIRSVLCLAACVLAGCMNCASAMPRSFTVADSIELTEITEPRVELSSFVPLEFNWSPDGRHVAMVTRRGELSTGENRYELRVFSKQELEHAIVTQRFPAKPPGHVVLSMATSSYKDAIDRVSWGSGGRFLYCIGRDAERAGQVYEIDLDSGRSRRLTSHPEDISAFTLTADRRKVLFSALEVQSWTERNRRGYVVGAHPLWEFSMRDTRDLDYPLAHYLLDLESGTTRRLDLPLDSWPYRFVPSPDGRYVVYPAQVRGLPPRWREYDYFKRYRERSEQSLLDLGVALAPVAEVDSVDPTFGRVPAWQRQYYLIDLQTGAARSLLDAPALFTIGDMAPVRWSPDGGSIVVSHTYLPFEGVNAEEAHHRQSIRMIAEVDVRTGAVVPIADQPETSGEGRRLDLRAIDFLSDGSLEIRMRASNADSDSVARYVRNDGEWVAAPAAADVPRSADQVRPLKLEVRQDMNTVPDVFAVETASGRSVRITDLNPQLRRIQLGHVEHFDWDDGHGRRFRGGLMYPSNYVRGKRMPVVLQTYGFREDEFVVDGPNGISNAYAARALLSHGFLVLQMPELTHTDSQGERAYENAGENPLYLAALEAAIDALDHRGLIDPARVGIIGFSREGMHAQYAVTFGTRPIAAAVISDSLSVSPYGYIAVHGSPLPGIVEFERGGLIGASFWGEGIDLWKRRSPAFNFDRIRTPIRLETMGFKEPPMWDMYMLLTRHRRPVELIHIPREVHPIQTPWGRHTSQQGTVDWFAFWLNGTEDPDPAKQEQYRRWRVLREQQAVLVRRDASASRRQKLEQR